MNYADHCRTCLERNSQMRHIHSIISIGGEDIRLSDILLNYYSLQLPDDIEPPNKICINCVHHLTLTHSFKTLVHNSAKTLEENISSIKEYISDDNNETADCSDSDYIPEIESIDKSPVITYKSKSAKALKAKTVRKIIINQQSCPAKELFCVECKTEFYSVRTLKEHCKKNHPPKNLTGRECEYCHEKFEEFKDLVIHRKLHLRPFLCLICWNGFYEASEFNNHTCQPNQNRRSKGNEKVLRQCDQCGKSYPPGYIRVHMMTHGNDLKYSCKYCPKKFKVANSLNSHVLWNHKRTRNHKCDVCGASFISASAKSTHIRKNHLKEKKYGCESCAKRFFSKSELTRHMLTHTGVKNFHCHLCDKSYQTRYGLNVHLKSHNQLNADINVLTM